MSGDDELPYEDVLGRIGELAEALAAHPDAPVADGVVELLDWVDTFHRDGLGRLVGMIHSWRGEIFLEAVAADPVTSVLLDAYGLREGLESLVQPIDATRAPEPGAVLVQIRGHEIG